MGRRRTRAPGGDRVLPADEGALARLRRDPPPSHRRGARARAGGNGRRRANEAAMSGHEATHDGSRTSSCTIRRGVPADAAMLATLGARIFRETFAADNAPADMDAYVAHAYGPEQQRLELALPDGAFLIAEVGGRTAGYAFLRKA